jgi:hypothetical protein
VRRWLAGALSGLLALAALPATGHEMDLARYRLERDGGTVRLVLELPSALAGSALAGSALAGSALAGSALADPGALRWPPQCVAGEPRRDDGGGRTRLVFEAVCDGGLERGDTVEAPWGGDGAVFTSALPGGGRLVRVLAGGERGVTLPVGLARDELRPTGEVLREYGRLGVTHILEGWDHLAFVLCLFVLAGGRVLVALITAFTVGHSLSLALATLGVVTVPAPPVEAVIALSIVFMAREALLALGVPADGRTGTGRHVAVVAGFGILHGLGFASVLGELGVTAGERNAGLLSFNLGVELGQLLFVAVLAALWAGLRSAELEGPAARTAPIAAGLFGGFWFAQRLAALAGG